MYSREKVELFPLATEDGMGPTAAAEFAGVTVSAAKKWATGHLPRSYTGRGCRIVAREPPRKEASLGPDKSIYAPPATGPLAGLNEDQIENLLLRAVLADLKAEGWDPASISNRSKCELGERLRRATALPLRSITGFLRISKSSYEYWRPRVAAPRDRDADIRDRVVRIFREGSGCWGYRTVWARLRREGVRASEKRVARVMREEGLEVVYNKRRARGYSSYAGEVSKAPENLVNRNFHADEPNRLWLTDITEFRLPGGEKVYLSPVIDCFDGMPVAWSIGLHPDKRLANSSLRLIQARFQTRQAIESQVVGDLRDALDRNRAVRQRPCAIDSDNTRQQKRQIVVEHLVLETVGQQIALGNLVLERRTKTSHKIIERNVLDQLTIEHQVVAQRLVNGFKEGRRRAQGALVGVTVHGSKRFLDRVDNHLHHIDGNGIEQAINRTKVHVEGFTVDIGLARDGTHRNVCQRIFHEQALESGKDGIAAANDAAIKTRFAGVHGRVPSICGHSSTDER